jgi:hypothetical protein
VFQLGVKRTDIYIIDVFLSLPFAAFLLTALVIAGFVNAINIIDGFHGLASGSVIAFLAGIAGLAWLAQDAMVFRWCLLGAGATLGFLVWNWPWGRIFLGDGGAYLLGFWVVFLGLMIPHRTPEISPMAPVLVGIYPVVETVYDSDKPSGWIDSWIATFAFSGQIFCDFAGYSTTAIGVALCLGFAMPDNFRFPYASVGFSDFWRLLQGFL